MLLSENIRRVGMETREGLDGAVSVGARIGGTVERWRPGSWAVCLVGGPLVSLECGQCWVQACWRWMQLDSLDAPLAAFSQLACSHSFAGPALIVISPKCQNRIMDMPTMRLFWRDD